MKCAGKVTYLNSGIPVNLYTRIPVHTHLARESNFQAFRDLKHCFPNFLILTEIAGKTRFMNLGEHLKNELKERQERNPSFSLRSFAKWLGVSPAHLSQLISGKRKVTPKVLKTVSSRLGLSPSERTAFLKRTLAIESDRAGQVKLKLSEDQFHLISDWYHLAILSLLKISGAKSDPRWIARRLGITATQAVEAVSRLERLSLIETAPSIKRTSMPLKVSSEVRSDAIRAYHKQNLRLALEKVDTVETQLREFQAVTMAIDPAKLPRARKLIEDFLTQMDELFDGGKPSEVYTVALQLFPVTQGDTK